MGGYKIPQIGDTPPTVMYVPPMMGSEIRLWKAEMPTNCTVLSHLSPRQIENDGLTWKVMTAQYGQS